MLTHFFLMFPFDRLLKASARCWFADAQWGSKQKYWEKVFNTVESQQHAPKDLFNLNYFPSG